MGRNTLVSILAASLLSVVSADAATLFVDGELSLDCTSSSYNIANRNCSGADGHAWNTIQEGVDHANGGDTVVVRAGIYSQNIYFGSNDGGSAGSIVTFKNYGSENPVVDCNSSGGHALHISASADFVTWDGIDVREGGDRGVVVEGEHVTIRNAEVYNNSGSSYATGISLWGDHGTVDNCEVHDNQWNGIAVSANHCVVKNCAIYNNSNHYGVQFVSAEPNIPMHTDASCHHNKIWNNYNGILVAHYSHLRVWNNVIYDNKDHGISFNHMGQYGTLVWNAYTEIHNNAFADNGYAGIKIALAAHVTMKNNIFANNGKVALKCERTTGHVVDYNLYFPSAAVSGCSKGNNGFVGDPAFVDQSARHYDIQETSEAIDRGTSVSLVSDDMDGTSRPQGTAYDIGAYEYGDGQDPSRADEAVADRTLDPDGPPDAGPTDSEAVLSDRPVDGADGADGAMEPRVRGGCSCTTGGADTTSIWLWLVLLAGVPPVTCRCRRPVPH